MSEAIGGFFGGLVCSAIGLGITLSVWSDVHEIKGPEWYGERALAKVVDAEVQMDTGTTSSGEFVIYDELRAKYELEVDGEIFYYPYDDGYAAVPLAEASADFIEVLYLDSNPARNHPASQHWEAGDQITALCFGLFFLQLGLLLMTSPFRGFFTDD